MHQKTRINLTEQKYLPAWAFLAALIWISIAVLYQLAGIDWLKNTDSGWYWKVVENPAAFDSAIQPLYPVIVRGLMALFPGVQPVLIGQAVSLFCYTLAVLIVLLIFLKMKVKKPVVMTLLWALFPLVGVTMCVYPRANALLFLVTALCFWGFVNDTKPVFLISAAFLPLIHRSALFFLVVLLPIAVIEKKIKWWQLVLAGVPTLIYILLGSQTHGSFLWFFDQYQGIVPITPLPLGDGLVGTLLLGIRGNLPDLIQGSIVVAYFLFSIYLLVSRAWKKNLFILSTIIPVIVLGLVLPAREIWSMINYSAFSIIAFSVLPWHDEQYLGKPKYQWLYALLVVVAFLSQFAYAFYDLHYYGLV